MRCLNETFFTPTNDLLTSAVKEGLFAVRVLLLYKTKIRLPPYGNCFSIVFCAMVLSALGPLMFSILNGLPAKGRYKTHMSAAISQQTTINHCCCSLLNRPYFIKAALPMRHMVIFYLKLLNNDRCILIAVYIKCKSFLPCVTKFYTH